MCRRMKQQKRETTTPQCCASPFAADFIVVRQPQAHASCIPFGFYRCPPTAGPCVLHSIRIWVSATPAESGLLSLLLLYAKRGQKSMFSLNLLVWSSFCLKYTRKNSKIRRIANCHFQTDILEYYLRDAPPMRA